MQTQIKSLTSIYDDLSERYDDKYAHSEIHDEEDCVVGRLIRSIIDAGSVQSLLDVGCGTGHIIKLANIPPEIYTGIDISKGMVEKARAKFPEHRFNVGDARLIRGRFDMITAIYIQVNYIGLAAFKEILRLNGDQNTSFIAIIGAEPKHEDYSYSHQYQKFYSNQEIKTALNCAVLNFSGGKYQIAIGTGT